MRKKTLYVNISDFGSIADANPFKSREEVLIKCWCKKNSEEALRYFKECGYVIETDEKVTVAENIVIVENEFKKELELKRPNNDIEADIIKEKYAKKLKEAAVKDKLSEEAVKIIQKNISSTVNKKCGKNTEKEILDKTEKKTGVDIVQRNDKMYYKTLYEDDCFKFLIGGKVDGISEQDIIIEAKYRTRESNVRKNEYDLYQLMGYIFVTGKSKGKLIQKYRNNIWDSDTETEREWGIISLDQRWDEFINFKLFTFFEELKSTPKDFSILNHPFLTISKNQLYPSCDNRELEKDIIKLLYPFNSQNFKRNYTRNSYSKKPTVIEGKSNTKNNADQNTTKVIFTKLFEASNDSSKSKKEDEIFENNASNLPDLIPKTEENERTELAMIQECDTTLNTSFYEKFENELGATIDPPTTAVSAKSTSIIENTKLSSTPEEDNSPSFNEIAVKGLPYALGGNSPMKSKAVFGDSKNILNDSIKIKQCDQEINLPVLVNKNLADNLIDDSKFTKLADNTINTSKERKSPLDEYFTKSENDDMLLSPVNKESRNQGTSLPTHFHNVVDLLNSSSQERKRNEDMAIDNISSPTEHILSNVKWSDEELENEIRSENEVSLNTSQDLISSRDSSVHIIESSEELILFD